MHRKIMSIILGVMVFGLLQGMLQAGWTDPNHPGPSNSRYENPSIIHSDSDEGGWVDTRAIPELTIATDVPPIGGKNIRQFSIFQTLQDCVRILLTNSLSAGSWSIR